MQVLKFGGSSVANAQNMNKVIAIVKEAVKKDKTAVVSSAISGATDGLIKIAKAAQAQDEAYLTYISDLELRHFQLIDELLPIESVDDNKAIKAECSELFNKLREICKGVFLLKELSELSLDHIVSFGELLSTKIISTKLSALNINHLWKDSRDLIKTEYLNGKNVVNNSITHKNIADYINEHNSKLYILPGFIASDFEGRTTTLGRGGSDYTASIIAVGAEARVLEIWTDVCGMMTADPRIVPDAKPIRSISYKEALELSHFGAKVIYPPTIQPVVKQGIPIFVKNTFVPEDYGTLIERNPAEGGARVTGISSSNKIALLSMEGSGMIGVPGYASRLLESLTQSNVNIILITQASSVHTLCIAIDESDAEIGKKAADEMFAYDISLGKVDPIKIEKGFSIVTLVGDMKDRVGTSGKMFSALGKEGVNIRAIAQGSSEKNISTVVNTEDVNNALRAVHNEFFSESAQSINLFIAGYGTVGKALVDIINAKKEDIKARTGKKVSICGLCNSKNYIINRNGLELPKEQEEIKKLLAEGDNLSDKFVEAVASLKLANAVFADCTANKVIAGSYSKLFNNNVSVVTCNKIANSAPLEAYQELFANLFASEAFYKYETTVCAALPVLATVNQLNNSGDKITKIEGILSGTLNYLFSSYNGTTSFSSMVKDARERGYAEPDPRLDLAGTDVFRKFIITAREAGEALEGSAVDFNGFIPDEIMANEKIDFNAYADEFYQKLEEYEPVLRAKYDQAASKGEKLRFIASLDKSSAERVAKISLESVGANHPFYNLEGTDNAVIIESEFYPQGIVIKGAGAGAKQTAGGILNDILV